MSNGPADIAKRIVLRVDGHDASIAYTVYGHGTPVLAVTGWAHAARDWAGLSAHAPGLQITALELPGHGSSPPVPPAMRSLSAYARIVRGFVEATETRFAAAIGHSMGALLLNAIRQSEPALFPRVVLIGPPFFGVPVLVPLLMVPAVARGLLGMFAAAPARLGLLMGWIAAHVGVRSAASINEWVVEDMQAMHVPTCVTLLGEIVRHGAGFAPMEPRPGAPLMLLRGSRDGFCTLDDLTRAAAMLKPDEVVTLDGLGHACQIEDPAAVARAVAPFLSGETIRP